jgi:hypothetical protein
MPGTVPGPSAERGGHTQARGEVEERLPLQARHWCVCVASNGVVDPVFLWSSRCAFFVCITREGLCGCIRSPASPHRKQCSRRVTSYRRHSPRTPGAAPDDCAPEVMNRLSRMLLLLRATAPQPSLAGGGGGWDSSRTTVGGGSGGGNSASNSSSRRSAVSSRRPTSGGAHNSMRAGHTPPPRQPQYHLHQTYPPPSQPMYQPQGTRP